MKQEFEPCLGSQGRVFKAGDRCFRRALTDEWKFHQARRGRGSLLGGASWGGAQPGGGRQERRLSLPRESSPAH